MNRKILSRAIALLCVGLVGCGSTVADSAPRTSGKVLKIGVRSSVVNFAYQNPDTGRLYGLGVDIGAELATRLGRTAEYVVVDSGNREEKLESGEVDCLVAAYTITPERQEKFDFSPAYYHDSVCVLVENSTGFSAAQDLRGGTIGVLRGTTAPKALASGMKELGLLPGYNADSFDAATFRDGISFSVFDRYDHVIEALESGSVDAAAMDASIANGYLTDSRTILAQTFGEESYGVATQKSSALSEPVATAIQAMLDDGTIDSLIDKWD